MSKYLITGATGNLGGASVDYLLKAVPANQVSVLARDPAKADRFENLGVNVIRGDYFDYQSLVDAFRGVEKLLLIGAPSLTNRAPQHENMMKAVKAAKVGHVIYVTLQRKEGSKLKLREVTDVENEASRDSGVNFTILRNTLYSGAFKVLLGADLLEKGVRAFGPEGKTTYAELSDLAQANANLLLDDGYDNRTYTLNAGEQVSFRDIARLLSEVYGRPIEYKSISREQLVDELVAAGTPRERAEYAMGFVNAIAEGEFSEASNSLEHILGRKPVTLRQTFENDLKSK